MKSLAHQRCFNHAQREAAARCPECLRFFCRECVTEHEDRVICAACLTRIARVPLLKRPGFGMFVMATQCLAGVLLAWFVFYLIGSFLVGMPTTFHEGTLWRVPWLEQ